ncbi:hypothetical protein A3Q56_02560 [Intoshia linei]|uniref:Uncharacterized protein n=1 Tax=Intoshia linei TaxID=1819745 RepID=A0A177B7Q5_9BILA|nr:hypothetical protein A3Q56_02560 [Intoshia linei]
MSMKITKNVENHYIMWYYFKKWRQYTLKILKSKNVLQKVDSYYQYVSKRRAFKIIKDNLETKKLNISKAESFYKLNLKNKTFKKWKNYKKPETKSTHIQCNITDEMEYTKTPSMHDIFCKMDELQSKFDYLLSEKSTSTCETCERSKISINSNNSKNSENYLNLEFEIEQLVKQFIVSNESHISYSDSINQGVKNDSHNSIDEKKKIEPTDKNENLKLETMSQSNHEIDNPIDGFETELTFKNSDEIKYSQNKYHILPTRENEQHCPIPQPKIPSFLKYIDP